MELFFYQDDTSSNLELDNQVEITSFCEERLKEDQPRDNYKELLELAIQCVGGTPKRARRGKRFMQQGAIHHARWMAKAIYLLSKNPSFHEPIPDNERRKCYKGYINFCRTVLYLILVPN